MATDPHLLFEEWLAEARLAEPNDPEAMALATADRSGRPSVRMVLLKGHDQRGFVFYTNSLSRKGGELAANPQAALLFHWQPLGRQVRIDGRVERVTDEESAAYFRPVTVSVVAATVSGASTVRSSPSTGARPGAERMTLRTRWRLCDSNVAAACTTPGGQR